MSNNNHDHNKSENDKLIAEISELELSVSNLHAKNNELNIKIDDMTCKILALTCENKNPKLKVDKYKSILEKFTYSSKKLEMILNHQREVYNRAGWSHKLNSKQKIFKFFLLHHHLLAAPHTSFALAMIEQDMRLMFAI